MHPLLERGTIFNLSAIFSVSDMKKKQSVDYISYLPPELGSMILRQLSVADIGSIMSVNRYWRCLCLSDPVIRSMLETSKQDSHSKSKENVDPIEMIAYNTLRSLPKKRKRRPAKRMPEQECVKKQRLRF